MAQGDVIVTVVGNITGDPELRFTQSGAAVANLTVVKNNRVKQGDQWADGPPDFYRVNCWRQLAENAAESLRKGDRVIVTGVLKSRAFETQQGEKRTSWEITADAVGPDLRWATAQVRKVERQQGGQNGYQQQPQQGYGQGGNQQQDAWDNPPQQQQQQRQPANQGAPQGGSWGSAPAGGGNQQGMWPDEPPFAVDPRAFEFTA